MSLGQCDLNMGIAYLLIGEAKFGCSIEGKIVIIIFLVEILFELMIVQFFFLIPVAYPGGGGVSVTNIIVMHEVILL